MLRSTAGPPRNERLVTVLDAGSSKICCLIVAIDQEAARKPIAPGMLPVRIAGMGFNRSRGIRAGVVTDLAAAELSIRKAVGRAEEQARATVEEAVLSAACGRLRAQTFVASANVERSLVSDADVARALTAGRAFAERESRVLLHLHRNGYRLDGQTGIRNPRGMSGERLSVELTAVTADEAPLRNLRLLIERTYLSASAIVAAPYASALAVATEDELQLGVTVIDMGAETTGFARFSEKHLVDTGTIAVGGAQLTLDIARTLSTPRDEAERIKTLYGNLAGARSDEHETISHALAGERRGDVAQTTRAKLRRAIRPRIEETLSLVRERLQAGGGLGGPGGGIVLTGGASQLAGLEEVAERCLGQRVRIASPRPVAGVPESALSPQFAVAAGLARSLFVPDIVDGEIAGRASTGGRRGYLGQMGRWLRESFWDEDRAGSAGER
jgi:cell division protein FtsA